MTVLDGYPTVEKPERFTPSRLQTDKIKIYPPLKAESEELVGYLRSGGCTVGCGACCEAFVVPIKAEGLEDKDFAPISHGQIVLPVGLPMQEDNENGFADWEHWLALHNTYLFQMPGGLLTAVIPVEVKGAAPMCAASHFDAWVIWLERHGITLLRRTGRLLAYVPIRCGSLSADGACSLFGSPQRPRTCTTYPEHPQDVEGLEFCTYRFRPIQRGELLSLKPRPAAPQPKNKRKKVKGKRKKRR
jgi:hypothetical protein